MKSYMIQYLCIFLFVGKCAAQNTDLSYSLMPNQVLGTLNGTEFSLNTNQQSFLASLKPGYNFVSAEYQQEDGQQYLYVRYNKQNTTYLIGLSLVPYHAAVSGEIITHTCTGSCSDGITGVISYCSSCDFVRKNGVITGCTCKTPPGCCVHSISSTTSSFSNQYELKNYLASFLK